VVAYFGSEGLYAYDFDGNLLWKRDLGVIDAGASYDDTYDWGVGSSPIVFGGLVIVLADSQGRSFMAAFDVATGEPAWRVSRDVISSFSTPSLYQGLRTELITNGAERMIGYDPATGRELWRLSGSSKNTTPTPVVSGDLIFITSGYRMNPIFAVRPGGSGDIGGSRFVAWQSDRDGSYMTTPLAYGGFLYTCQNNGVLSCYRAATGERVYQRRIASGAFSASPIASDGKIYFASEDGDVYVVRAGAEYELLATNPMGEVLMATPAATARRLLLRGQNHLFSVRQQTQSPPRP
jgi:outer membrane protein assembly factor BamB